MHVHDAIALALTFSNACRARPGVQAHANCSLVGSLKTLATIARWLATH